MGCTLPAGILETTMTGTQTAYMALGGAIGAALGFGPILLWQISSTFLALVGTAGVATLIVACMRACHTPNPNNEDEMRSYVDHLHRR